MSFWSGFGKKTKNALVPYTGKSWRGAEKLIHPQEAQKAVNSLPIRRVIAGTGLVGGAGGAIGYALPAGEMPDPAKTHPELSRAEHKRLRESPRNYEKLLKEKREGVVNKYYSLPYKKQNSDREIKAYFKKLDSLNSPGSKRMKRLLVGVMLGGSVGAPLGAVLHDARKLTAARLYNRAAHMPGVSTMGSSERMIDPLINKLKAEGISTHKQFVAKYHPDVNSQTPKEIMENFSAIVDRLRSGPAQTDPLREKVHQAVRSANEAVRKAHKGWL